MAKIQRIFIIQTTLTIEETEITAREHLHEMLMGRLSAMNGHLELELTNSDTKVSFTGTDVVPGAVNKIED